MHASAAAAMSLLALISSAYSGPVRRGSSVVIVARHHTELYQKLGGEIKQSVTRLLADRYTIVECGGTRLNMLVTDVQGRRMVGSACKADYAIKIRVEQYLKSPGAGRGWSGLAGGPGAASWTGPRPVSWPIPLATTMSRIRYHLNVSYEVYDVGSGVLVRSSKARARRSTSLSDDEFMQQRLVRDVAFQIARAVCRGTYPDVMVAPNLSLLSPLGENETSFNIRSLASSGRGGGTEITCILARVVGLSMRYDYQRFIMDKVSLTEGEAFYRCDDFHLGLLLGKRYGLGPVGYLFPHGAVGFNVSGYEEAIRVRDTVATIALEPTGMFTIGGGIVIRPAIAPIAFSVAAEVALGNSAYTQATWDKLRSAIEEAIREEYGDGVDVQVPSHSPDYNVSHVRLAIAIGYAL